MSNDRFFIKTALFDVQFPRGFWDKDGCYLVDPFSGMETQDLQDLLMRNSSSVVEPFFETRNGN